MGSEAVLLDGATEFEPMTGDLGAGPLFLQKSHANRFAVNRTKMRATRLHMFIDSPDY